MKLGNILKTIRQKRNLSLSQLGAKVELSKAYLSEIENDKKTPNVEILNKICEALDIPIEYLLLRSLEQSSIKNDFINEVKPLINKISDQVFLGEVLDIDQETEKKISKER